MNPSDIKTITLRVNSTDARTKLDELERRLRKANDARAESQRLEQAIGEQIAEARRRQEQLNATLSAGNHTTRETHRLKADLRKATQELTLLERKQAAARKDAARHLAEATRTEQRIEQTRGRYAALEQTLAHLGRATAPQLREAIRTLERTLGSGAVERGTQEWAAFEARLRECNRELRQLERNKQPLTSPPTPTDTGAEKAAEKGLAGFGLKWVGLTGVLSMSTSIFNNLTASASALVREYAEMDERLADVRKYTGLAERDVSALNDAFRRMDTRTPREQLNALAADAGRLGIQSREGVQEFVEAADMINVALGQDLGEDAVKQIGKLTQLFEVDKTLGLKQGMLATASVINELAQSSSAAEPYIMEFTARLSGVGHTAGIAQPKIMALAAVLDQSMVGVEKGATALQNILTALFRKPADMAAVAGLKVQEFTRLLRTDANAALLAFVEGLKHTGGMDRIAPILDQLKLNGSGATQVLTALAANLDTLRATQQQATAAFAEGTSVQREFAAANSTTQAQLEKTEKRMKDARIAIGRAFAPIAERVLSASAGTLQALAALLRALIDHRRLVLVLATAWAAYAAVILRATIAARLHAAATLLVRTAVLAWRAAAALSIVVTEALRLAYFTLTGQTMAAASAQMALSVAMAATPIGALLALISLAVVAYKALAASISSTEAAEQSLEGVRAKARQSVEEERTKIELLRRAAMDETLAMDERRKAVDRLNAIIPHYNAQIDTTTGKYRESKAALDDYLDSLRRKYELEGAREALTNLSKQIVAAELEEDRSKAAWQEQRNFNQQDDWTNLIPFVAPYRMGKEMYRRRQYAVAKNERATLQAQREAILARYGRDLSTAEATGRPSATTASEGAAYTAPAAKTSKSEAAERERRRIAKAQADIDRQAEAARQAAILRYQTGETDLLAHRERLLDIERDTLVRKRDIYQAGTVEHTRAQADIDRLDREHAKKHQDWSLEVLDREQKDELAALDHRAAATLMKDEDVQRERNRITLDHLRRRADLLRRYGRVEEHAAAEQAYAEESARQRLEQERKWAEAIRKLREDYARKSAAEVMALEQQTLETARRKGLVDEETYQKLLRQIRLKYQGLDGTGGLIGEERTKRTEEVLDMARPKSKADTPAPTAEAAGADFGLSGIAATLGQDKVAEQTYDNLRRLRDADLISQQDYTDAVEALDRGRFERFAAGAKAAYTTLGGLMQAAGAYNQAAARAEEAKTAARYDAEIRAAEGNTERVKKLEAEKAAALADIKSKANKRAMAIEIAQATAAAAMAALNAYRSTIAIPVVGPAMAPIAAAAAAAFGAVQIATIVKQHEAQEAGYYEGGFTGGTRYRRRAGVVHEGEFVANHHAVQNPVVLPVLRLLDHAQRHNTVASLTAADVSRAIAAAPTAAAPAQAPGAPTVQVVPTEAPATLAALRALTAVLEDGISATVAIDGHDGVAHQLRKYNSLNQRK